MTCKFLRHYHPTERSWSIATCAAKGNSYVPSMMELDKFCGGGRHAVCAAFLHPRSASCPGLRLSPPAGS